MKENPLDRAYWMAILAIGAVATAGTIAYVASAKTATPTPAPAPGPTPTPTGGPVSVALQAGTQTVTVVKGNKLTITPPAGASWSATNAGRTVPVGFSELNTALPTTGSAPLVLTFVGTDLGPSAMLLSWTDSSGAAQSTILYISPV